MGVIVFLVLIFSLVKMEHKTDSKRVEVHVIKSAQAKALTFSQYVGTNDDAYKLIQETKKHRMLATVIKEYNKEHPQVVKPATAQSENNSKKQSEQSAAPKPQAPPAPPVVPTPQGPQGNKIVYLTIDDGPSEATATINQILNQYQMTATFFMLEPHMRQYSDAVKNLAKSGFGLGLHGVTHNKKLFYKSTSSVVAEMKTAQDTLQKLTGVKTNLMRVPYGSVPYMTPAYRAAEVQAGFIMWDWNIDSRDWDYKDARFVTSTIQQLQKLSGKKESAVILIHDLPTTAKYLPKLLDYLKSQKYELRKIDASISPMQFKPR
ncbi:MAG: polysaccharide deacetylase family protein [Tuberibacillus sp.]